MDMTMIDRFEAQDAMEDEFNDLKPYVKDAVRERLELPDYAVDGFAVVRICRERQKLGDLWQLLKMPGNNPFDC